MLVFELAGHENCGLFCLAAVVELSTRSLWNISVVVVEADRAFTERVVVAGWRRLSYTRLIRSVPRMSRCQIVAKLRSECFCRKSP